MLPSGTRESKHHQWFTPEHGDPKLREHLNAVIALMRIAQSWQKFLVDLDVAFPKLNENLRLRLDD